MSAISGHPGGAFGRLFFFLILAPFLFQPALKRTTQADESPATVRPQYLWPTNAGKSLSSSFAETRPNHFHFGIDVRTQQRVGFPCYAVADGHVTRLKVSPYGYGRALYLRLDDGNTAVYAHLQKFAPEVEKVVKAEQMKQKRFGVEMFFDPGVLPFQRGDVVAYTGESGVGPPHLHFEIRNDRGYRNPHLFGLTVDDNLAPVPQKVGFFPLAVESEINGDFHLYKTTVAAAGNGRYSVAAVPSIYGPVGLGVTGYDRADGSPNQLCFYGLDLYLDDSLYFSSRYDGFDYEETKMVDLDRDYRQRKKTGEAYHHLWKDPSATLAFYRQGEGIIDTRDFEPGLHYYRLVLTDFAGNAAQVSGKLDFKAQGIYPQVPEYSRLFAFFGRRQQPEAGKSAGSGAIQAEFFDGWVLFSVAPGAPGQESRLYLLEPYQAEIPLISKGGRLAGKLPLQPFPAGYWTVELQRKATSDQVTSQTASWYLQPVTPAGGWTVSEDGNFAAQFEPGDLYRTLYLRVGASAPPAAGGFVGPVYHLDPDDMPLKGSVCVSIDIPPGEPQPEKLGLYGLSPKGVWKFLDCDREKSPGSVSGKSPRLEHYALRRDVTAPAVTWLAPAAQVAHRRPTFRLSVRDDLSGLDDRSVNLEVDGQFVLLEYDGEARTLFGSPDQPLAPGDHKVTLTLRDFSGNETRIQKSLKITG